MQRHVGILVLVVLCTVAGLAGCGSSDQGKPAVTLTDKQACPEAERLSGQVPPELLTPAQANMIGDVFNGMDTLVSATRTLPDDGLDGQLKSALASASDALNRAYQALKAGQNVDGSSLHDTLMNLGNVCSQIMGG